MFRATLLILAFLALPSFGTAATCGDGAVEPGETCDDGNVVDGDCCSSACLIDPPGAACTDDGNLCTNDTCNGAGTCFHGFEPAATCIATVTAGSSSIAFRSGPRPRVGWQWRKGAATAIGDFGDPTTDTDYALCVYDHAGGASGLALKAEAPAGINCLNGPCWRATAQGFTYNNQFVTDGINKMKLLAGPSGKARIVVTGQKIALAPVYTPLHQDPNVVVQLRSSIGTCWETIHSTAKRNELGHFAAKSD